MLKIGELAQRAGCLVETIRFYERDGLLPAPSRSAGNYRLYDDALVRRLQFIRQCRLLDMSLDEIKRLLRLADTPAEACGGVDAVIDQHIEQVSERIRELYVLERALQALRSRCPTEGSSDECGILRKLSGEPEQHG